MAPAFDHLDQEAESAAFAQSSAQPPQQQLINVTSNSIPRHIGPTNLPFFKIPEDQNKFKTSNESSIVRDDAASLPNFIDAIFQS